MSAMQWLREYAGTSGFERRTEHREAMLQLRHENLTASDVEVCVDMYHRTKDPFTRTQLLTALVLRGGEADLEDFFLTAAKRLRLHELRLLALRGYAATAAEEEVEPLMEQLAHALAKVGEQGGTPYQLYEYVLSPVGLPYLVDRYGYDCFVRAQAQVRRQYEAMPEEMKGLVSYDEHGEPQVPGRSERRLSR